MAPTFQAACAKYNARDLTRTKSHCAAPAVRHEGAVDRPIFAVLKSGIGSEMGIKFLCPNGHKLHVKTFLSGKRALCPKCGARVIVPSVSDPNASTSGAVDATATNSIGTASTTIEIVADETCAELSASPATRVEQQLGRAASVQDAISEAPGAVWYVRPATGGQFGPASADVMRSWLNDGRVSASSLVWRAGWPDWLTAAAVFPQLATDSAVGGLPGDVSPQAPMIQPSPGSGAGGTLGTSGSLPQGYVVQTIPTVETAPAAAPRDAGVSPISQTVSRRRRQRDVRLYTSAVLAVVSVILMIVLFVVFRRGEPSSAPDSATAEPTADSLMQ
jgi:hypothetical protein